MKNAALCQTVDLQYHLYYGGKMHPIDAPIYLESWLPIFAQHDIDVMWVMPDTELSRHISWNDFDRIDRDRNKVFYPEPRPDRPAFVSVRKRSTQYEQDHYFAFPAHGEWNSNDKGQWFIPSPHILGQTISYLRKEFDMDIIWSPGNMGMKELKRDFQRRQLHFTNTEMTDYLWEALNPSKAMFRPVWKRYGGLSDEQKLKRFLHGYDKRRQFLGASQSVYLGNGTPEVVTGSEFDMGKTGFWRYRVTDVSNSAFDGDDLPCPLDIKREYASTDLLRAARYARVEFDIIDGIVWPKQGKYLENWAKTMWKHGENLGNKDLYPAEIARENAVGTAKLAGNSLMGRLAKPGGELYKPDWNLGIVHKAIGNQVYSLNRWCGQFGIKPVLISTDAFWIVSDEQDPALAIPGILEFQNEQRGYHHVGTLPMTDEIIYYFNEHSPEAVNGFLKREVEGHVESV